MKLKTTAAQRAVWIKFPKYLSVGGCSTAELAEDCNSLEKECDRFSDAIRLALTQCALPDANTAFASVIRTLADSLRQD
jgi:dihydropteroate synthase